MHTTVFLQEQESRIHKCMYMNYQLLCIEILQNDIFVFLQNVVCGAKVK